METPRRMRRRNEEEEETMGMKEEKETCRKQNMATIIGRAGRPEEPARNSFAAKYGNN
jgi:hypothetical protein